MKNIKLTLLYVISSVIIAGCVGSSGNNSTTGEPQTAPSLTLTIQDRYKNSEGQYDPSIFLNAQSGFFRSSQALRDGINDEEIQAAATSKALPALWQRDTIYSTPGTEVLFAKTSGGVTKTGIFINFWWTQGEEPTFFPDSGKPWSLVQQIDSESNPTPVYKIPTWDSSGQYTGGYIVYYLPYNKCYKAQWWVQGTVPPQNPLANSWENPWQEITCPAQADKESTVIDNRSGEIGGLNNLPIQGQESTPIESLAPPPANSPAIPVAVPVVTPTPTVKPIPITVESQLPSNGYALLRRITDTDWNWLFPLSYGKSNALGGTYNNLPYTTNPGDIFTLSSFKKAVLEYNAYAAKNNFKQFLNDGNKKQQAEEFAAFMSNVSRETSGSWANAPTPWIEDFTINGRLTKVWKGGLYWVQEVGYSTNDDGTSPFVSYIDASSDWKPVQGRSYHGRGPIQLSWNYNYGAFSAWLYDNGLYAEKIKTRDALLINPGLVNSDPVVSMLSAIWFWMTPQGPKPSAHDVIYGAVTNVSKSSSELGLPPTNNGTAPMVATGDTTNQRVMAYRFGTTINIINGGIECNGAAAWHYGPPQRISYYNAYAAYLNQRYNVGATIIDNGLDIWNAKVSKSSPEEMQSATCFNQKSYYGW